MKINPDGIHPGENVYRRGGEGSSYHVLRVDEAGNVDMVPNHGPDSAVSVGQTREVRSHVLDLRR